MPTGFCHCKSPSDIICGLCTKGTNAHFSTANHSVAYEVKWEAFRRWLAYAAELVCLPDKRRVRPQRPVSRKVNPPKMCLEMGKSSGKIQLFKLSRFGWIDSHHMLRVDEYQTPVKCSVIRRRERKSVPYLIRAPRSCNGKNVGSFDQSKLHSSDCAPMTISI